MIDSLKQILNLTTKYGFLKNVTSDSLRTVDFGPLALLVAQNIKNQWFQSNLINTDLNIFLYESHENTSWQTDCQFAYRQCLQTVNEQLPFGLASVLQKFNPENVNLNDTSGESFTSATNAYRSLIFIDRKESQRFFYRLQHQRKIWWRKFSLESERIQIVESKPEGGEEESVHITAKFPWGTQLLETISNQKSTPLTSFSSVFEAKVGRKRQLPDVIECVSLEKPAVITYLCDAFQQLPKRSLLRLHHRLAPYKAALAFSPSEEKCEELDQLGRFVSLSLRQVGLHILYCRGSHSKALESQLSHYDTIGVPYTVVLTSNTLNNGIVNLRSRDTTLSEQVHVSKLVPHLQKLMSC